MGNYVDINNYFDTSLILPLFMRMATRTPILKKADITSRLKFVRSHVTKLLSYSKTSGRILWSDESRVESIHLKQRRLFGTNQIWPKTKKSPSLPSSMVVAASFSFQQEQLETLLEPRPTWTEPNTGTYLDRSCLNQSEICI